MPTDPKQLKQRVFMIFSPFAILGIVIGIGGLLCIPIAQAIFGFDPTTKRKLLDLIWILAGLSGLLYSFFSLRPLLKQGLGDRIIFFVICAIFVALIAVWAF